MELLQQGKFFFWMMPFAMKKSLLGRLNLSWTLKIQQYIDWNTLEGLAGAMCYWLGSLLTNLPGYCLVR